MAASKEKVAAATRQVVGALRGLPGEEAALILGSVIGCLLHDIRGQFGSAAAAEAGLCIDNAAIAAIERLNGGSTPTVQ